MALIRRPRARRLIESAARAALTAVEAPTLAAAAPEEPAPAAASADSRKESPPTSEHRLPVVKGPAPEDFRREPGPAILTDERDLVSAILYGRLDPHDVAEVVQRMPEQPGLSALWAQAPDDAARRFLVLCAGIWLGVTTIAKKTGLGSLQPPEEVHAMARGPLAAAGGLYEADLIADALASAGTEMEGVRSVLDFGCSSGRVVRVLAAAYPDVAWHACDPNGPAIAWASENLPGIDFFVSADEPPLSLETASLDLVYAISIWSHFQPGLGLRWFEEMRRIIRPGGHLVCTTHGFTSVAHDATRERRTPDQCKEIAEALYRSGWWYTEEFGEEGDWGVVNPDWGTAFLSPEWVLTHLCPRWRVLEFAPGRNQDNQDVYVLQRA
jgi:SAM-dependent methyltransferase